MATLLHYPSMHITSPLAISIEMTLDSSTSSHVICAVHRSIKLCLLSKSTKTTTCAPCILPMSLIVWKLGVPAIALSEIFSSGCSIITSYGYSIFPSPPLSTFSPTSLDSSWDYKRYFWSFAYVCWVPFIIAVVTKPSTTFVIHSSRWHPSIKR